MKEKATLFLSACKVVAELDVPPNGLQESLIYAHSNLVKLQTIGQWR